MENIKIVVTGHVDHGKSTLIGRLLYDTNTLLEDKIEEVAQVSKLENQSIDFAYFLDHLQEEREQNITIETTQIKFQTNKRTYSIIDAPGHVEFMRNMVTGASRAEFAILIVDAAEGCQEQTIRHALMLSMLGVTKIILVINKMDSVGYRKEIFCDVVEKTVVELRQIDVEIINTIPVTAIEGDNVSQRSSEMPWYLKETLVEALDLLEVEKQLEMEHFVYPVQDIYLEQGKRIVVGMVEAGIVKKDMPILIHPSMEKSNVELIKKWGEELDSASCGESIGIIIDTPAYLEAGQVFTELASPIKAQRVFKAKIVWISKKPLDKTTKMKIQCLSQETPCKIRSIDHKFNTSSLEEIYEDIEQIQYLEMSEVTFETKRDILLCPISTVTCLGRFVLIVENDICGYGIVIN